MTEREALKLALEALEADELDMVSDGSGNMVFRKEQAITAIKEALASPIIKSYLEKDNSEEALSQPEERNFCERCGKRLGQNDWDVHTCTPPQPKEQGEPVALEAVYETIIEWDEGGGKRSRRELARSIVSLYTTPPQPKEQNEPVAWLITDEKINSLQVKSIQTLIDRARHAHHTDICLRINGQDERYEADWLKHMVKAAPQQRTWVGLTDEEHIALHDKFVDTDCYGLLIDAVEAKLRSKNI